MTLSWPPAFPSLDPQISRRRFFGAAGIFTTAFATKEIVWSPFSDELMRAILNSTLRITDLRIAVIKDAPMRCPIIRIDTSQNISGYGEMRDGSEPTTALNLKSLLLGRDPFQMESILKSLKPFSGHGRAGGAISGIEMALWDIIGKSMGLPVYELFGVQSKDKIRLYADTPETHGADRFHADGRPNGLIDGERLKQRMNLGYTYLKFDMGVHLLERSPDAIIDAGGSNSDQPRIKLTDVGIFTLTQFVKEIRSIIGYDVPLAVDHFGPILTESCIRLAHALLPYRLAWLEDMVPWQLTHELKTIADSTSIPILSGEDVFGLDGFQPMIDHRCVDYIQPDIATAGGILETKRISDAANRAGIPMVLHYAGSPIGFAASLHCASLCSNFLVLENHSVDIPWWEDLVIKTGTQRPLVSGGFAELPDGPGLGVEPNELVFREHLDGEYFGT